MISTDSTKLTCNIENGRLLRPPDRVGDLTPDGLVVQPPVHVLEHQLGVRPVLSGRHPLAANVPGVSDLGRIGRGRADESHWVPFLE